MKTKTSSSKPVVLLLVVIVALVAVAIMLLESQKNTNTALDQTTPRNVVLEGEIVCLPHADDPSRDTTECATGLHTDDDQFYVLDTNNMTASAPQYGTNDRIRAAGTLTAMEKLSSDKWKNYHVQGIFSVNDSFEVIK